ncbi:MAG: arginine--tRNA ligase [Planctomycetota bacterium]|nr:MAG: arginine--tRNA ligase [Planctomycetota bacterium]
MAYFMRAFRVYRKRLKNVLKARILKVFPQLEGEFPDIPLTPSPSQELGDFSVPCFFLSKLLRISGEEIAQRVAKDFEGNRYIGSMEASGPYLNFRLRREFFYPLVIRESLRLEEGVALFPKRRRRVMIEYSSPNTNKPMHLGHVRNNVLGMALGGLLETVGWEVILVNLVNDRGIHICKSMLAYEKWGEGATPEAEGLKGDAFVGRYYVMFEQSLRRERERFMAERYGGEGGLSTALSLEEFLALIRERKLVEEGLLERARREVRTPKELEAFLRKSVGKKIWREIQRSRRQEEQRRKELLDEREREFLRHSELMAEATELLRRWEAGDQQVRRLWRRMNRWVYRGFRQTYRRLGCRFDKWYYESETYRLGKELVQRALKRQPDFVYRRSDGSVWARLEGVVDGIALQEKLLLRGDGTSVYITQDMGTAVRKFQDFPIHASIYVVASEQRLHFINLFEILKRLGYRWADRCYHFCYGMVTLPRGQGKLKSREGTAVDADDLLDDLEARVREKVLENGNVPPGSVDRVVRQVALGALKFFILLVNPGKDMVFDPGKAIEFTGDSGPSIQYSYARIRSIYRKASSSLRRAFRGEEVDYSLLREGEEEEILFLLFRFDEVVWQAAEKYSPSILAHYLLQLSRAYARFQHSCPVLGAEGRELRKARLGLCLATAAVLRRGCEILGIPLPSRM